MKIQIDAEANEASFRADPKLYGEDALQIAAHVFERRAEVFVEEGPKGAVEVTLAARRKAPAGRLERLAREFLNELLNVEYRRIVGEFNKELPAKLVMQALYASRGEGRPPVPAPTPEQQAEIDKLLAETKAEIERTMPKRLPSQGAPISPVEDAI